MGSPPCLPFPFNTYLPYVVHARSVGGLDGETGVRGVLDWTRGLLQYLVRLFSLVSFFLLSSFSSYLSAVSPLSVYLLTRVYVMGLLTRGGMVLRLLFFLPLIYFASCYLSSPHFHSRCAHRPKYCAFYLFSICYLTGIFIS